MVLDDRSFGRTVDGGFYHRAPTHPLSAEKAALGFTRPGRRFGPVLSCVSCLGSVMALVYMVVLQEGKGLSPRDFPQGAILSIKPTGDGVVHVTVRGNSVDVAHPGSKAAPRYNLKRHVRPDNTARAVPPRPGGTGHRSHRCFRGGGRLRHRSR